MPGLTTVTSRVCAPAGAATPATHAAADIVHTKELHSFISLAPPRAAEHSGIAPAPHGGGSTTVAPAQRGGTRHGHRASRTRVHDAPRLPQRGRWYPKPGG